MILFFYIHTYSVLLYKQQNNKYRGRFPGRGRGKFPGCGGKTPVFGNLRGSISMPPPLPPNGSKSAPPTANGFPSSSLLKISMTHELHNQI